MKSVAPASNARSIDCVSSRPVIITTGTRSPPGSRRSSSQAVKPSITGMLTSSSTRSGRPSLMASSASWPSAASLTRKPALVSVARVRRRLPASSSTTRMCGRTAAMAALAAVAALAGLCDSGCNLMPAASSGRAVRVTRARSSRPRRRRARPGPGSRCRGTASRGAGTSRPATWRRHSNWPTSARAPRAAPPPGHRHRAPDAAARGARAPRRGTSGAPRRAPSRRRRWRGCHPAPPGR